MPGNGSLNEERTLTGARAWTTPPPLEGERARRRRLATMRRWATSLLVVVTAAWLVLVLTHPSGDAAAAARATLEASMVGALADWFAVTALFRHPLGLPIPHTAVVVERKDQFARTLATFFRENFLSRDAVASRVRASGAVGRVAAWGAEPEHARTVARHLLGYAGNALDAAGPAFAASVAEEVHLVLGRVRVAGPTAAVLHAVSESPQFDDAFDGVLDGARRTLARRHEDLVDRLTRDRPWWLPEALERRAIDHLVARVDAHLAEARANRPHPWRTTAREQLRSLATRIESDEALAGRVESWKQSVVDDERFRAMVESLVEQGRANLRGAVATPGSRLELRLAEMVRTLAARVRDDDAERRRIEDAVETAAMRAVVILGADIDALVTGTIARWDADRTATQLELLLGPDLQFIRINGTVVGALAGLAIFWIGRAIS
jgi:uncharacterized membrane-anchored protein YjiN (DUF445 family)